MGHLNLGALLYITGHDSGAFSKRLIRNPIYNAKRAIEEPYLVRYYSKEPCVFIHRRTASRCFS